jgi:hypothetical protein
VYWGGEITHSANISPNGIAKGIEHLAEEASQQHMIMQPFDGTNGLELCHLAEDTNHLLRGPSWLPLMIPLQTNAQEQPVVCRTSGPIQVSQNSSSAEERDALVRASHIPSIGPVLERHEDADESEIQGSPQPSEIGQGPEVSEPLNAAKAIHSCHPEGCRQSSNPAAFDLSKPTKPPSISLLQEAAVVGIQRPEEPHIPRLALEEMIG